MDLSLYGRVLWRFRIVVALGVILALALAFLAMARVDPASGKVTYRSKEQWAAYSQLLVKKPGSQYDPVALVPYAVLWANMADNDPVLKLAFGRTKIPGTIEAATIMSSPGSTDALPIISIAGIGDSPKNALYLARAETRGMQAYAAQQQQGAPAGQRVQLDVVKQPNTAQLLKGRSKTVPIVVFLTVLIAALGLVFVLENLRPRIRVLEDQDQDQMRRANVEDAKSRTA